jgi:peptide/nickel transport system ATP-binding protein
MSAVSQPGDESLLVARELSVRTRSGSTIVRDLNLHVNPGEAVAIVGESGSGKSMTAKALIGLLPPGVVGEGEVELKGDELMGLGEKGMRNVRGGRIGLVMQDPFTMLNPLFRCGEQVIDGLRDSEGRRLGRKRGRAEAIRRLAEVGIKDPAVAGRFPFELSGGMRQRVGIACALLRGPELLIADEPSTALDVTTQREILDLLASLRRTRQMGLILITHDLRVASETCDRIYVMYAGSPLEVAGAEALNAEPRHPYTLGLLAAEPPVDRRLSKLPIIEGSVPRPDEVAGSCSFAPRCRWAQPPCRDGRPQLSLMSTGTRWTACIRTDEIRDEMRATPHDGIESADGQYDAVGEHLIEVRGLIKTFGDRSALASVSLDIGERESVGLVGESGSGKTTLGRCIMGLEKPTAGSIEIAGIPAHDLDAISSKERAVLRRKIQMVFQDPYSSLNPVRTVGATLLEAILARESKTRQARQQVGHLLNRVGLPGDYAQRKPAALSGGERQRVAIARALAMRPCLIVCDEPVSALDVSVQAQVLNLLTELREEYDVGYLFITHDLAVVRQIVDRLYVLHNGTVVESGPADRVLDEPTDAYTRGLIASIPGHSRGSLAESGEMESAGPPAR